MGVLISMLEAFPGYDAAAALEQVMIIDKAPPGSIKGIGTGRVLIAAETTKGPCNTPRKPSNVGELESIFGGFDLTITTLPGTTFTDKNNFEGNLYWAIMNRRFAELAVVRPDVSIRDTGSQGAKVAFTLTRTPASTTATAAGSSVTSLPVADITGFKKVVVNGERKDVSADNPMTVLIAGTEATVTAVTEGVGTAGTLTLSAAASWSEDAAVVRKLAAYTLPGGTVIEGENDDDDTVQVATMDDVTFAAGVNTASVYARPITANVSGKAFSVTTYNGLTDVLVSTANSITYPKTTLASTGDKSAAYPDGQTLGASGVSHSAFTASDWATTVNNAYAAAIGYSSSPGGMFSAGAVAKGRTIIASARHWAGDTGDLGECAAIHTALKSHVADSALTGVGAVALLRPPLHCDKETALSASAQGVSTGGRSDRAIYCFPGVKATLTSISTDPIDTGWDTWMASVLSQINPEESPAQYHGLLDGRGISEVMQIKSTSTDDLRDLAVSDYKDFKAAGVCAPDFHETHGWTCYSGVTTDLTSGREQIYRRRMADYVAFSYAAAMERYKSTLPKPARETEIRTISENFFDGLKSENTPEFSRIEDYSIDIESGNTAETEAKHVKVIKIKCKLYASSDTFVIIGEIGENVVVQAS